MGKYKINEQIKKINPGILIDTRKICPLEKRACIKEFLNPEDLKIRYKKKEPK